MGLRWLRCGVVLTGLVALGAGIGPMGAQAQGGDDLAALSAQVNELHGQGKYTEAMPIAERYVALWHALTDAARVTGDEDQAIGIRIGKPDGLSHK